MPTTASISATAANTPISHIVKRDCDVWLADQLVHRRDAVDRNRRIGRANRRANRRDQRGRRHARRAPRARPASCDRRTAGRCPDRRSGCPAARDTSPRRRRRRSTATGWSTSSAPNFTRLPIGSCPGQNRLTTRSLTIDGRRRRGQLGVGERAAGDDRDAQRAEELRRDAVHVGARHVLRVDRRLPFGGVERRRRRRRRAADRCRARPRSTPGIARSAIEQRAAVDDRLGRLAPRRAGAPAPPAARRRAGC